MLRHIEYGSDYTICYEIDGDVDGDVDGAQVILKEITTETGSGWFEFFDKETIEDMKFHCKSDFLDRQYKHYLSTGETLND